MLLSQKIASLIPLKIKFPSSVILCTVTSPSSRLFPSRFDAPARIPTPLPAANWAIRNR